MQVSSLELISVLQAKGVLDTETDMKLLWPDINQETFLSEHQQW